MHVAQLQLIRKPDRDWNEVTWYEETGLYGYNSLENPIGIETWSNLSAYVVPDCYNSLENPIGIETRCATGSEQKRPRYNSLENPIGIETSAGSTEEAGTSPLQLIRKPDRDWNTSGVPVQAENSNVTTH